jgi:hypothetical protein
MERTEWMNLNGLWDYAIVTGSATQDINYEGKILVPYPIESSLSGVKRQLDADNGLMTYDREVVKIFEDRIREANRKMIETNSVMTSVTGQRVKTDTGFDTLYNAQGMRISQPMAGINIIHYADGTTLKFISR